MTPKESNKSKKLLQHQTRFTLRWGYLVEFLILFAFWVIFSGRFEVEYLAIGAGAAALATFLSRSLVFPRKEEGATSTPAPPLGIPRPARFIRYVMWFLWEMIKANIQLAWIVIQPRLPIAPAMFHFQSSLTQPVSQVTLGNSITMTPGTLTVVLKDGHYIIHALVPEAAETLITAEMQNHVAEAFRETKEQPPDIRWAYSIAELTK